jgi:hypothetical protein
VDIAWKTALAGGTILLITRLSLEAVATIDHWILASTLLLMVVFLVFKWFFSTYARLANVFQEALLFLLVMTLTLYYILPLGITAASFVSGKITAPLIQSSQEGFDKINQEFSPAHINTQLFAEETDADDQLPAVLDCAEQINDNRADGADAGQQVAGAVTVDPPAEPGCGKRERKLSGGHCPAEPGHGNRQFRVHGGDEEAHDRPRHRHHERADEEKRCDDDPAVTVSGRGDLARPGRRQ